MAKTSDYEKWKNCYFFDLKGRKTEDKPVTIDELFTTCAAKHLIVDRTKNTISFDVDDQGIVTSSGFWPNGCVDDCFRGFILDKFRWLKRS
ncbi:MAG: hypothetical protein ACI8YP_003708 [Algoriphagus sp.]|jgi:hypothetical protein